MRMSYLTLLGIGDRQNYTWRNSYLNSSTKNCDMCYWSTLNVCCIDKSNMHFKIVTSIHVMVSVTMI
jgi:hypothetical protein